MTLYGKAAARLFAALFLAGSLGTAAAAARYDGEIGPYEDMGAAYAKMGSASSDKNLPVPEVSTSVPSAELTGFWEKLRTGTVEPACRKVEIKLNKDLKLNKDILGGGLSNVLDGKMRRAIKKFPDGKLALVDEVGLTLNTAYGHSLLSLPEIHSIGISASVYANFSGKSQVVRPIANKKLCLDALEIAKFWEFKTVLPATVKRVKKMEVGEIWKVPMSMSMGFGVGASANIQQIVTVSVSYSHSRTSRPSVTLRLLEPNKLRLRIRLDRIKVNAVGVGVSSVEIPLDAMGLEKAGTMTAEILNKYAVPKFAEKWVTPELFDKLLKSEINKYLALKMSFGHSKYSGKKLLLEYILDPANDAHMNVLHEFLRGDFAMLSDLARLGVKFNKFEVDDDAEYGLEALKDAAGGLDDSKPEEERADGDEQSINTFSGTDIYSGQSTSLGANIPVVGDHNVSWGSSYHRYQSAQSGGETLHVHQRTRSYSGSHINIPFMGTLIRNNSQRDVLVLNNESTGGALTKPVLLYQQMDGFVNRGNGAAENLVEKANSVLRYVGMDGKGTSGSDFLPSSIVNDKGRYSSAVMSLKLLINDAGVQDILGAPAETVMRAFMNVMREAYADIVDKVRHLFFINKKGKVDYDRGLAAAILQVSESDINDAMNPLNVIDSLVYEATSFIRNLATVRAETDWKKRSQRLADVAAGKGRGTTKYEDFFKVVLQLVKPEDVSAQVYVAMNPKKKGEADVSQSYNFYNSGTSYDATLAGVTQMRERFAEPTELSD